MSARGIQTSRHRDGTITYWGTIKVHGCPTCGTPHGIPSSLEAEALNERDEGRVFTIYCPLGHTWHFTVSRGRAEQAEKEAARLRAIADRLRDEKEAERRSHIATKGQLTKARKRAANGVCPCCKRTFVNVARHVAGQHPDFAETYSAPESEQHE